MFTALADRMMAPGSGQ